MEQVIILMTGAVAIWLINDDRYQYRKYACVIGLVGQPFWFHSAYIAEQWGVLSLVIVYTVAWAKGFYLYWVKK